MDGQIWLFINQMSERSDGEAGMRASRKRSNACLDWPDHESLIEARHLRARTVWRWAAEAMSRPPAQAAAAWVGASIAARSSALLLSRVFSIVLIARGAAMLRSAIWS